jgi:hypothetical protein
MDQGGYGIDQAYLWYRRDGLALAARGPDPRVRPRRLRPHGRRPLPAVWQAGAPRPRRPARCTERARPRTAYLEPWITQNLDLLTSLYTFEVLRRVARAWAAPPEPPASDVAGVALRVFDGWRGYLAAELGRRDIPYLDLVPELRRLGRSEQEALFIPLGALDFPGAEGHYTARGNRFVAGLLLDALRRDPETASRLGLAP